MSARKAAPGAGIPGCEVDGNAGSGEHSELNLPHNPVPPELRLLLREMPASCYGAELKSFALAVERLGVYLTILEVIATGDALVYLHESRAPDPVRVRALFLKQMRRGAMA